MPVFMDTHPLGNIPVADLHTLQKAPKDEFGIVHVNIHYSEKEDKVFCVLDAPDSEAVRKHHEAFGLNCEWIVQIESTAK
ncbi:MAG: DUF4242 domain-containing protein [Candidatus Heimdallarchaeota archaeon]|nr:DUF4242 domain-containing protein [Candidatus Heimdallarchaeota archaeon]